MRTSSGLKPRSLKALDIQECHDRQRCAKDVPSAIHQCSLDSHISAPVDDIVYPCIQFICRSKVEENPRCSCSVRPVPQVLQAAVPVKASACVCFALLPYVRQVSGVKLYMSTKLMYF